MALSWGNNSSRSKTKEFIAVILPCAPRAYKNGVKNKHSQSRLDTRIAEMKCFCLDKTEPSNRFVFS